MPTSPAPEPAPARLQNIRRWRDYEPLQGRADAWVPHLEALAARHGVAGPVTLFPSGTHVTGARGEVVIKLFLPFWRDGEVEAAALRALDGQVGGVKTPSLIAEGDYQGWRYVLMTRLPGVLLSDAWGVLSGGERVALMGQAGQALSALHRLPLRDAVARGDTALSTDWAGFIQRQRAQAAARQRDWGLSQALSEGIPALLDASLKPLHLGGLRLGWLHGDLTAKQLLVSAGDAPAITAMIDFGDARIGYYEYDVAGAAAFMARGDRDALRAFLLGYGYPAAALTPALGARLLGWLLLHDHGDLRWLARTHLQTPLLPTSWPLIQRLFFPL